MYRWLYFLTLLPSFLLAATVELTHNWTDDPNDQHFLNIVFPQELLDTLQENNIHLHTSNLKNVDLASDTVSHVVVWNKPHFVKRKNRGLKIPRKKALLFAWEPPTVQRKLYSPRYLALFKRIYTWDDDLVDNKRYFKFYYPVLGPMIEDIRPFEEKKLLTFMFSDKSSKHPKALYAEREKLIQFFEEKPAGEFEFYGRDWKNKNYKNYKGASSNKIETLKHYRFVVCYENMRDIKGYITEKIFEAFAAGTVPIYWGASNVQDYIPKTCFIDRRDFKDNGELYTYLKSIDAKTYQSYIDNIRQFLESDQAQLFSQKMFQTIFLEAIRFP
jgi:hypothetical protein